MRMKNLLKNLAVSLAIMTLSGCASSPDEEALKNPKYVLEQAQQAYFAKDYQRVFDLVFPLASAGNDQAQYTLGYLYYHGLGVTKSDVQAMNWIQRAAAQGNKKALEALRQ